MVNRSFDSDDDVFGRADTLGCGGTYEIVEQHSKRQSKHINHLPVLLLLTTNLTPFSIIILI